MNINQVRNNKKVKKALSDAAEIATKPINLKTLDEWNGQHPKSYTGLKSAFLDDNKDSFDVYVGDDLPIQMTIHEIIHSIMISENYPELEFDLGVQRRSCTSDNYSQVEDNLIIFYNKFMHLEVYRRMREFYGLAMELYQKKISAELECLARVLFENGSFDSPLGKQAQIFNVFDLMALVDKGHSSLELYRTSAEDVYTVADKAFSEVKNIGLSTPALAKEAGDALLKQIISYGDSMGNEATNDLWRALKWETS